MISVPDDESDPDTDDDKAMPELSESHTDDEPDPDTDDEDDELPGLFDHLPHVGVNLQAPHEADEPSHPPDQITTLEVMIVMLDWMASYKASDVSTEDMWRRLRLFLPGVDVSTFNHAKGLVIKHRAMTQERIEMCVNDCIAYWDCKHIPEQRAYKHSHRTMCPKCGEPRYIEKDGRTLPRKVVHFTPIHGFLQNLYRRTDLVPYLHSAADGHPPGHPTRSRGWKKKVQHHIHVHLCHIVTSLHRRLTS